MRTGGGGTGMVCRAFYLGRGGDPTGSAAVSPALARNQPRRIGVSQVIDTTVRGSLHGEPSISSAEGDRRARYARIQARQAEDGRRGAQGQKPETGDRD